MSWSAAKRFTWTSGDSFDPVVTVGSAGYVHVVWCDESPGNFEVYYRRSTDGGANWSSAKRLTWVSGSSYYPIVAADSSGYVHVVWQDDSPGNNEIYYKRSINGGVSWESGKRLTWAYGGSYTPDILVDSSDNIHVFLANPASSRYEIYYKKGIQ